MSRDALFGMCPLCCRTVLRHYLRRDSDNNDACPWCRGDTEQLVEFAHTIRDNKVVRTQWLS